MLPSPPSVACERPGWLPPFLTQLGAEASPAPGHAPVLVLLVCPARGGCRAISDCRARMERGIRPSCWPAASPDSGKALCGHSREAHKDHRLSRFSHSFVPTDASRVSFLSARWWPGPRCSLPATCLYPPGHPSAPVPQSPKDGFRPASPPGQCWGWSRGPSHEPSALGPSGSVSHLGQRPATVLLPCAGCSHQAPWLASCLILYPETADRGPGDRCGAGPGFPMCTLRLASRVFWALPTCPASASLPVDGRKWSSGG